ncbi:glycosyl transferase [Paenibacillus sp. SYP-B3998]|uniref:Glycosyl transferase n=1 Tax=Paenibacillus sp. SYP-B3998 TaxID=2678564 RepID=A0A6G3ZYS7_9BACL|nr:macrolide family glycosyltransferase [Paenibacillus sp. SYP-B3998]NEW06731.1 glycosyl transferase [Paenibacillus sp. SYP-B3998]
MANVLFINWPAEGHMNPTIGLVKELVRRGEKVTYYCTENFRPRLEQAGAVVRTYENEIETILFPQKGNVMDLFSDMARLRYLMLENSYGMIQTILPQVQNEQYDYVIYDEICMAGWVVAEKLNLPKVISCTTFAFHPEFDAHIKDRFPIDLSSENYRKYVSLLQTMEQEYDVDLHFLKGAEFKFQPVDLKIVFTSAYFQKGADKFGDGYRFVGPSIATRVDAPDFPFEALEGHKVIFISMGTIINQQQSFYQVCFEAFKDFDAKIVLSVGKQTNIEEIGPIPDNFIVKPYVPQLELLQHVDVFFTHGGMNSASEGLYYGKPLAVLPITTDQPIVAARVAELGAGIILDFKSITPTGMRSVADELLSDSSYRERAEAVGASFREAGGACRAAEELLEWQRSLSLSPK